MIFYAVQEQRLESRFRGSAGRGLQRSEVGCQHVRINNCILMATVLFVVELAIKVKKVVFLPRLTYSSTLVILLISPYIAISALDCAFFQLTFKFFVCIKGSKNYMQYIIISEGI